MTPVTVKLIFIIKSDNNLTKEANGIIIKTCIAKKGLGQLAAVYNGLLRIMEGMV